MKENASKFFAAVRGMFSYVSVRFQGGGACFRKTAWAGVAAGMVVAFCGCESIANRLADAIEPQLERIVDSQIEREEKLAGIWGTTNSYFYAERSAEEEAIRTEAAEMVAVWSDEILQKLDAMISDKMKKGGR